MEKRKVSAVAALVVLLVTLPYIFAAAQGGQQVFGGFLLNPIDGNSYLAKMYQGWSGSWRFVLPFTAEPGQGAYLFLFYLFLGHLARWISLPLIWMFHLTRVFTVIILIFSLSAFFQRIFPDQPRAAWMGLLLASFGSGMGWIAALFGALASDLWVAEAYPFLSSYANPHFPLGIALLLWIFIKILEPQSWRNTLVLFFLGLLLSIIMPFGVVLAAFVCMGKYVWDGIETRKFVIWNYLALFIGGGLFIVYQFWISSIDPILAGWNWQNVTPSPTLWDLLLSFSPAFLFAFLALRTAWQRRSEPVVRLLLIWFLLGLVLVYIPFYLQRRFMFAFYVPVAALGIIGLEILLRRRTHSAWLIPLMFSLAMITNLVVLAAGIFGAIGRVPQLYYTEAEAHAMDWIQMKTPGQALVLSGAEMGLFIPAHTGRRVIYGHPFETVAALQEQSNLINFFEGKWDSQQQGNFLSERKVDLVFYGEREQKMGRPVILDRLPVLYQSEGVTLYGGQPNP